MFALNYHRRQMYNAGKEKKLMNLLHNAADYGSVDIYNAILDEFWENNPVMEIEIRDNVQYIDDHIVTLAGAAENIENQFCCCPDKPLPVLLAGVHLGKIYENLGNAKRLNTEETFINALGFYSDIDDKSLVDTFSQKFTLGISPAEMRKELTKKVLTNLGDKIYSSIHRTAAYFEKIHEISMKHNLHTVMQVFNKDYTI